MRYPSKMSVRRMPTGDGALIQIVDAALADAARRSGEWLVCRPGCTQCCVGVFAINQLDAARLQQGLADLKQTDPQRARKIRQRARKSIERLSAEFPATRKLAFSTETKARRPKSASRNSETTKCVPYSILRADYANSTIPGR